MKFNMRTYIGDRTTYLAKDDLIKILINYRDKCSDNQKKAIDQIIVAIVNIRDKNGNME